MKDRISVFAFHDTESAREYPCMTGWCNPREILPGVVGINFGNRGEGVERLSDLGGLVADFSRDENNGVLIQMDRDDFYSCQISEWYS